MPTAKKASSTAWEFLRKNPDYISDWHHFGTMPTIKNDTRPFNIYEQHPSDLSADKWGLFTFQDPMVSPESSMPFWSIAPTLEAEVVHASQPSLLPMLREVGAKITGLLLLNGDLVLKVEHGATTVQVRIKDAKEFDASSGLTLHLPLDLRLPVRLTRSMDLWKIAAGERFKKIENLTIQTMTSLSSFLMASSTAKATAR